MKEAVKKELSALQTMLQTYAERVKVLLQEEEAYACDLENETKQEESECRQELLSELEDALDVADGILEELLP